MGSYFEIFTNAVDSTHNLKTLFLIVEFNGESGDLKIPISLKISKFV